MSDSAPYAAALAALLLFTAPAAAQLGTPNRPGGSSGGQSQPTTWTPPVTPFPPPGHPLSPFTVDAAGDDAADALSWRVWWRFERERYLDLRAELPEALARTGDDPAGSAPQPLRPDHATIERDALPPLYSALGGWGSSDMKVAQTLALARICEPVGQSWHLDPLRGVRSMLQVGEPEVRWGALLALGVHGDEQSLGELETVAYGGRDGAEVIGRKTADVVARSHALYALALAARRLPTPTERGAIVRALSVVLDHADDPAPDAQVAAAIAMGLVPLPVGPRCDCEGEPRDAWTSRQAQMHALLEVLTDPKRHGYVRAHAAPALARLCDGAPTSHVERVEDTLLALVAEQADPSAALEQSLAIALGMLADAGADGRDARMRAELQRLARKGDLHARRFAHVALARAAARPGAGEDPYAGTQEARAFLRRQLTHGKGGLDSWAALALGVLGHDLLERGEEPSDDASEALRAAARRAKLDEHAGACALALGLRRDPEAPEVLAPLLAELNDADARGEVALALGLARAQAGREALIAALAGARSRGLLEGAAIALGLLGDPEVVPRLLALGAESEDEEQLGGIASALGFVGDARALALLGGTLDSSKHLGPTRTLAAIAVGRICDQDDEPWHERLTIDLNYAATVESMANERGTGVMNRR